jgi:hypothetical protein
MRFNKQTIPYEAPRGRSLLVDVSPDGRVSLSGRF